MLYQTHVRVHLRNIRFNLEQIRIRVGPERAILIAVKANGYGHGAVQIARMAEKIGIQWLGVSTVPEGIELRKAGISLPILKFSPAFAEEMQAAIASDITLCVCERENLTLLHQVAATVGRKIPVHLKIDTGMGRIGCLPGSAVSLATGIEKEMANLVLEGICTHLPVSDERNRAYTQRQLTTFHKTVNDIQQAIGRKVLLVHAANSGAVLAHPEGWFDMIRPGIMIYGCYPSPETPQTIPLRRGLSFLTRISFLKQVTKGTSIGYGRSWIAPEDTWIATFPAGYADGFNRLFSNSGRVLIRGNSYPVVGRVCMDQSMVNLGPHLQAQVGDEVVLIGESGNETITATEWADKLGTISYEVLCQISHRVARSYDSDDE